MAKMPDDKKKVAEKLAVPELVPQPHGGALLTGGMPGHKGAGGRPPDEFKAAMRELASSDERMRLARTILDNPDHPHFLAAWKFVTEQGYGKAKESVEHSGTVQHGVVILPPLSNE